MSESNEKNSRLYNALNQWMSQVDDWSHLSYIKTCIWILIALIHTGSVNLTKWAIYISCRGKFAQSRQRRVQRWLNNPRINVHRTGGWNVQSSMIRDVCALSRLWFILAVATLYLF